MKITSIPRAPSDVEMLNRYTAAGEYIQLFPGDTHKKWFKIVAADGMGLHLLCTRVMRRGGTSGYTPEPGSVYFYAWNKLTFVYSDEEVATKHSYTGY